MSILIALGCFTGLRISDILTLTWEQILSTEEFTITEKKTGKRRALRLNTQLQQHIQECYEHIQPLKVQSYILVSQKGTVFTILRINVILKEIKKLRLFFYICLDYELFIARLGPFGTP